MKTILFVCTGNTCRSSMAEALFRDMFVQAGKDTQGIQVVSAGISAVPGEKASPQAICVMKEMGIDISEHRSTKLTKRLVDRADLIFTMTMAHKDNVLRVYPEAEGKVFTLKEYANGSLDMRKLNKELDQAYFDIQQKNKKIAKEFEQRLAQLRDQKKELQNKIKDIDNQIKDLKDEFNEYTVEELECVDLLYKRLEDVDIADPFGQPLHTYRKCAVEIKGSIEKILEKIKNN
ncbi:MAG: protein tyrosine phosphatase [Clostridia bacterium]|nr:protein tyrosine phosphatase [Clostridia bacterium]